MEKYSFADALSWIMVNEMPASLTINGTKRTYYKNGDGNIMCTPNDKSHLTYLVKEFKIDAILSNDWNLID